MLLSISPCASGRRRSQELIRSPQPVASLLAPFHNRRWDSRLSHSEESSRRRMTSDASSTWNPRSTAGVPRQLRAYRGRMIRDRAVNFSITERTLPTRRSPCSGSPRPLTPRWRTSKMGEGAQRRFHHSPSLSRPHGRALGYDARRVRAPPLSSPWLAGKLPQTWRRSSGSRSQQGHTHWRWPLGHRAQPPPGERSRWMSMAAWSRGPSSRSLATTAFTMPESATPFSAKVLCLFRRSMRGGLPGYWNGPRKARRNGAKSPAAGSASPNNWNVRRGEGNGRFSSSFPALSLRAAPKIGIARRPSSHGWPLCRHHALLKSLA